MDQPVQVVLDLSAFSVINTFINLLQVWMLWKIIELVRRPMQKPPVRDPDEY